jgi:F0F1-type ATP synthase assembly protein I
VKMPPDDRAPLASAYQRASRGITVALGMVIPGLVGYFLDSRLGTKALLTILGFGLGVTFGIWELIRMARPPRDENSGM